MFFFVVKPDAGDTYEVTATSRDVLVWEKTNRGRKLADLATGEVYMTDLYKLAHIASRRLGLFTGSLPEFEESCELTRIDDEPEPDPTQPAP